MALLDYLTNRPSSASIEPTNPTRPFDQEGLKRIYEARKFFAANRRSKQIQQVKK